MALSCAVSLLVRWSHLSLKSSFVLLRLSISTPIFRTRSNTKRERERVSSRTHSLRAHPSPSPCQNLNPSGHSQCEPPPAPTTSLGSVASATTTISNKSRIKKRHAPLFSSCFPCRPPHPPSSADLSTDQSPYSFAARQNGDA